MKGIHLYSFFKDRLKELLHLNSLDSYRVRHHNVNTILNELRDFIIGWQNFTVKRAETVQLSLKEAIAILDKDEILCYPGIGKRSVIELLRKFDAELNSSKGNRNTPACTQITYLLSELLTFNKDIYLGNLFDSIEKIFASDEEIADKDFYISVERLDDMTSSLARELLNIGYSKRGLYGIIKYYSKKPDTIDSFHAFKNCLLDERGRNHCVVLVVHGIPGNFVLSNFKSEMDVDPANEQFRSSPQFVNFASPQPKKRFYVHRCVASDGDSAIKEALTRLSADIDSINLYLSRLNIEIQPTALVVREKDKHHDAIFLPTRFFLDDDFQDMAKSNIFRKIIDTILGCKYVEHDLKDRLVSALRHLRIGDRDGEIEQRFINYRIALEYIFSSPMVEENTFGRLKTNLSNILFINYVRRNFDDLENTLKKAGLISQGEALSDKNIDALIQSASNILLKYRLMKYKSCLFVHKDKRKNFVHNHMDNVNMHLSRIYHLRNELIHEAAIKQDIEDLTSNLRYYLILVITKMVSFFNYAIQDSKMDLSIEYFFYEMKKRRMIIEEDWSFDSLMRQFPYDD